MNFILKYKKIVIISVAVLITSGIWSFDRLFGAPQIDRAHQVLTLSSSESQVGPHASAPVLSPQVIVMPSSSVSTVIPIGTSSVIVSNRPESETTIVNMTTERFVVQLFATTTEQIISDLYDQGFIKNKTAFNVAYLAKGGGVITPGAYKLSSGMSALQVASVLHGKPYMKWVLMPPGLRKEEIALLLTKTLGWSADVKQKWITTYTAMKFDYIEGVYFPDTYLIPVDEAPLDVTNRILANFNEHFAPYIPQFNEQNIRWTTGLTFSSIVQREAANAIDMPLVAGILWNRLDKGMPLQVDATLQYVRGDVGKGWWAPIGTADKQLDSPYNTYKNIGLPPHPISNPGISAIEATLHPAKTDCLYYLHDAEHIIHCAVTYEEHQANIKKYLIK